MWSNAIQNNHIEVQFTRQFTKFYIDEFQLTTETSGLHLHHLFSLSCIPLCHSRRYSSSRTSWDRQTDICSNQIRQGDCHECRTYFKRSIPFPLLASRCRSHCAHSTLLVLTALGMTVSLFCRCRCRLMQHLEEEQPEQGHCEHIDASYQSSESKGKREEREGTDLCLSFPPVGWVEHPL
jgi:hypothetical protein